ncbi:hypothetical protein DN756_00990 [Yersinia pseudotuberculosis]|uniref:Uncharacterized protein n=2 Tax=Yersinia pseudotuberculosis complex TaxID=1649845 RepID=A0A0H3AWX9_YERPY|nr:MULTISPECIES: hypothetical protein [Yersinia pseudotuberculosis complex]AJJ58996.1 hypothetical protein BZ22_782 [Yersinia pseudotuberculosis YPIII]AYW86344.1 hypothetical protein EGX87_03365 [Yersinia pseudotuberculosis]AYX00981.1 hypothetical protein EGX53_14565 [Yersinia pseudotuberculosis]AZA28737.1 hypothetical protein DN756_00990 [Yersinia pseudotuberculosis]MBK1422584.1 hypothetical protein [Yersinia pseudotuberculosis]
MKPRQKRRSRRVNAVKSEVNALNKISSQLDQLFIPGQDLEILTDINLKLDRIETNMTAIQVEATRRGAVAGAIAGGLSGGLIATAIVLIKARLGL